MLFRSKSILRKKGSLKRLFRRPHGAFSFSAENEQDRDRNRQNGDRDIEDDERKTALGRGRFERAGRDVGEIDRRFAAPLRKNRREGEIHLRGGEFVDVSADLVRKPPGFRRKLRKPR